MLCPTCQRPLVTETERTNQICVECVTKVEAAPIADPRPRVPCRACGHTLILRTQLFDQQGESMTRRVGVAIADPKIAHTVFTGEVKAIRPGWETKGELTVYICRGCGFTELYTDRFADLPVGPQFGSELIDVGAVTTGAYR